jgi:hypothetical protein
VQSLKLVMEHFGLRFDETSFLTRCGKCNCSDVSLVANKEDLANDPRVPPKVYLNIHQFWQCSGCKHVCVSFVVLVAAAAAAAVTVVSSSSSSSSLSPCRGGRSGCSLVSFLSSSSSSSFCRRRRRRFVVVVVVVVFVVVVVVVVVVVMTAVLSCVVLSLSPLLLQRAGTGRGPRSPNSTTNFASGSSATSLLDSRNGHAPACTHVPRGDSFVCVPSSCNSLFAVLRPDTNGATRSS